MIEPGAFGMQVVLPFALRVINCPDKRERSMLSKRNSELPHGSGGAGVVSSWLVVCAVVWRTRIFLPMHACHEFAVH
jgi:hypothetical protein